MTFSHVEPIGADQIFPSPEEGESPAAFTQPTIGQFLEDFFVQLQQLAIPYVILRNYEGLPEKPGRDIDILTADFTRFNALLLKSAPKAGFLVRVYRRYEAHIKYHLIRWCPWGLEVLEIDVAWDIRSKGIPLIPRDLLQRLHPRPYKCFFTLPLGAEAAVSLTKHLLYHGSAPEKYKLLLPEMAQSDRESFLTVLQDCFGLSLATQLCDLTSRGDWQGIERLVPELRRQARKKAFKQNPLAQIMRWSNLFWWNLIKFFRLNGKFIVLIGPDGSGKSTVARKLQHYVQSLFQGSKYYHGHFKILPQLRDVAKFCCFPIPKQRASIADKPTSGGEEAINFGIFRSLLYLCYYSLDYFLGYLVIFRACARGELVIFDRYYYDYLIQPGMSLSSHVIMRLINLVPKPDVVFYLRNEPQVILARKPELTLRELERQAAICSELILRLPQGYVIETTGTPEETTAQVAKILVNTFIQNV